MSLGRRALIATLVRRLPTHTRIGLLISPATILGWHRRLIDHRWTTANPADHHPSLATGPRGTPRHREPNLAIPPNPRRARRPRLPHWRLHGVEDPQRHRSRPITTMLRTHLDAVPQSHGGQLATQGHHDSSLAHRVDRDEGHRRNPLTGTTMPSASVEVGRTGLPDTWFERLFPPRYSFSSCDLAPRSGSVRARRGEIATPALPRSPKRRGFGRSPSVVLWWHRLWDVDRCGRSHRPSS